MDSVSVRVSRRVIESLLNRYGSISMRHLVQIFSGTKDEGVIEWDGDKFSLHPPSKLLQSILDTPIKVLINGKLMEVNSQDDPYVFISSLHKHYRSGQGISATEIMEIPI